MRRAATKVKKLFKKTDQEWNPSLPRSVAEMEALLYNVNGGNFRQPELLEMALRAALCRAPESTDPSSDYSILSSMIAEIVTMRKDGDFKHRTTLEEMEITEEDYLQKGPKIFFYLTEDEMKALEGAPWLG